MPGKRHFPIALGCEIQLSDPRDRVAEVNEFNASALAEHLWPIR